MTEPMLGYAIMRGEYRYDLWRIWGPGGRFHGRFVNFIMLNPSTATADVLDPTVNRCLGFARQWGYDAMVVTNLFALRSTDPRVLLTHTDPVGAENDDWILRRAKSANLVVVAWGAYQLARARGEFVARYLREDGIALACFGRTQAGHPRHPLYLRSDTESEPFNVVAVD